MALGLTSLGAVAGAAAVELGASRGEERGSVGDDPGGQQGPRGRDGVGGQVPGQGQAPGQSGQDGSQLPQGGPLPPGADGDDDDTPDGTGTT
jgi:hypothetical protein